MRKEQEERELKLKEELEEQKIAAERNKIAEEFEREQKAKKVINSLMNAQWLFTVFLLFAVGNYDSPCINLSCVS